MRLPRKLKKRNKKALKQWHIKCMEYFIQKSKQKELLIRLMQEDEKAGLYEV